MEDSCGHSMWKRSSSDTKIDKGSSASGKSIEYVQPVRLPHFAVGKILKDLDFEDLLQCSLVSKFWNQEARRVLREKHECVLAVNLDKSPLEIMKFFEMTLIAGLPVPYVSLSIKKEFADRIFVNRWNPKEFQLTATVIKDFILRSGPFKDVQLDCRCHGEFSLELWLIRKLLTELLKTAQVLKIKNLCGSQFLFILEQYPEFIKLEVDERAEINGPDRSTLKNIINYSPKLETVGCLSSGLLYLVDKLSPTRKLALVKEFTCANMHKYLIEAAELASFEPKLEKLIIPRRPDCQQNDPERSISLSLLLSSEASLIELHATLELLQVVRHQNPLASFLNVRYLTVDTPCHMGCAGLRRNCPIIALFPNLERLESVREAPQPSRARLSTRRHRLMQD